jgi:two-component system phosphate regulon sensor histidine kinase PhoR
MDFSSVLLITLIALLFIQHLRHRSNIIRISKLVHDICARKQNSSFIRFGPRCLREAISDLELLQENIAEIERRIAVEDFNLRAILSGMAEGVFVTNTSGTIILANDQLTNLLQLKSSPLHKTVLEALGNHQINLAVKETLRKQNRSQCEITIRPDADPASSSLCFTLTSAPVLNSEGEIFGAVAVLHDITTLKKMENIQKEFVSNTSHELRTPLAIFRGYLEELLEAPPASKKELVRIIQQLLKQTDRLQALVQDLLTLSQFESRTITLKKQPLALSALIEQTVADLRRVQGLNQCTIKLKSGFLPDEDIVLADENRIKQVICNLLENSIKYSGPDGTITISTTPAPGGDMVECSVTDTGVGIPEKDLPHIFDRFYRADKGRVRSTGGTGLGLSIVKQIIESHGGTVRAASQVNEGTTITFTLPKPPDKINKSKKSLSKTSELSKFCPNLAISHQSVAAARNS